MGTKRILPRLPKKRSFLALASILIIVLLVVAACGEEATPTPVPATATPVPQATATPVPQATATSAPPTATPAPTIRPISEWTVSNPATLEELEAALEKHRGESINYVSWGGPDQAAERQAWLEPFAEQFGITFNEESPVVYAKVRSMAETGNILWDLVNGSDQGAWTNITAGAVEKLDFSIIDNRDYAEGQKNDYFGPGIFFSNVVLYSEASVDEKWGGRRPTTMADVFDVENFPGFRSFAAPEWGWKTTIRFALLSEDPSLLETDKFAFAQLTDAQVDSAFEILDGIKDDIKLWWVNGSDCPSLILSGELDICITWNGTAQSYIDEGEPIYLCWECGHLVNGNPWYIINGLKAQDPNKYELVNLYLAWMSWPDIMAKGALYIGYGATNLAASAMYDRPEWDAVRDTLPTSTKNLAGAIFSDPKFDGEASGVMAERYLIYQQE
ncbi:MAG: extracellular solute-binding protein [Dehalococcoidia bacterium]